MEKQPYDNNFYNTITELQIGSAKRIVSIIYEFIKPDSVVDVGCGTGGICAEWLHVGLEDVLGIDGDYVDRNLLLIPEHNFRAHDLTNPFQIARRYDLASSFEVAEHLDEAYAGQFVKLLCDLSDVVVFSAAIPAQGGMQHFNEQWQSYWCKLFMEQGYIASDYIRKRIAGDDKINFYYRQNVVTYIRKDKTGEYPLLEKELIDYPEQLNLVHPEMWQRLEAWREFSLLYDSDYANRKFQALETLAAGRNIVLWGAGMRGIIIDYFCDRCGYFPNRLFVDMFKEESDGGRIPITPLNEIANPSNKYFIIITPQSRNEAIEKKLTEMGYDEGDYIYFDDVKV